MFKGKIKRENHKIRQAKGQVVIPNDFGQQQQHRIWQFHFVAKPISNFGLTFVPDSLISVVSERMETTEARKSKTQRNSPRKGSDCFTELKCSAVWKFQFVAKLISNFGLTFCTLSP